jgi:hypothetical protein
MTLSFVLHNVIDLGDDGAGSTALRFKFLPVYHHILPNTATSSDIIPNIDQNAFLVNMGLLLDGVLSTSFPDKQLLFYPDDNYTIGSVSAKLFTADVMVDTAGKARYTAAATGTYDYTVALPIIPPVIPPAAYNGLAKVVYILAVILED